MSSVSLVDVVLRQQGTTPDFTRITAQTTAKAMKTALAMRAIAVPVMPRNVQSNKFLRHFVVITLLTYATDIMLAPNENIVQNHLNIALLNIF